MREAYADTRHSVPGSKLDERRRHLEAYQEHLLALVQGGPRSLGSARSFLEAIFLPLFNAGYVAIGGDAFDFVTAHGNTEVSPKQMMYFVSEQVYTIRHYALDHPGRAPDDRIGFSWDPKNRLGVPRAEFADQMGALRGRIADAIRDAYRSGVPSAEGACIPPGTHENWCRASRPGAKFTEAWEGFNSWS